MMSAPFKNGCMGLYCHIKNNAMTDKTHTITVCVAVEPLVVLVDVATHDTPGMEVAAGLEIALHTLSILFVAAKYTMPTTMHKSMIVPVFTGLPLHFDCKVSLQTCSD